MFQPLPLFVGLRYVRSSQHRFFVSFITWVSLAGVSLGVAALIVILSVMNGFEGELRDRLLSLDAHARLLSTGIDDPAGDERVRVAIAKLPGVQGVAPYMELTALAVHQPEMLAITLRGVDPQLEPSVADVRGMIREGSYASLRAGGNEVLIGADLAQQLGVGAGDTLGLLVPVVGADGTPAPRLREFTVGGIFEAGLSDHDASLVLADLEDVRAFIPEARGIGGLRLRFDDPLAAPRDMQAVRAAAGAGYEIHDWTEDHASYFRAIRIEKTMMALILLLIVAVAAFNIVAMLVMVVNDKRTDIAILRTYGTSPRAIMATFITQGLVIGWLGVIAGVLLGVLIASHVESIVPALEAVFRFRFLDASVYYDTDIPSKLAARDVGWISAIALLLTLLATLYPAWRASRTSPADALRYE